MIYFLDLGGWKCDSVGVLKKKRDCKAEIKTHSFEPAADLKKYYKNKKDIVHHDVAAWIYDGEIDFYLGKDKKQRPLSQASSLIPSKNNVDSSDPVKVECIDFSKWVIDNFDKEDYIILKLDIEGAEYDVLEKMLEDNSIDYINELYVEFHYKKCDIPKKRHQYLIERLPLEVGNWE